MIEHFAEFIPESMKHLNGRVFYSGREAFSSPSRLYVLGINPGGKPGNHPGATVCRHTDWVIDCAADNWSAYRDEQWEGSKPGKGGIQPSLLWLCKAIGVDPGAVPASNMVFARSADVSKYCRDFASDADECWGFHQEVIDRLEVEVLVVIGTSKAKALRKRLKANSFVKSWTDKASQPWRSVWYENADGLSVVALAHPSSSRGHQWTQRATDPTRLVLRALNT